MKIRADQRIGLLLAGAVLLTFVAIGATVALPASDPSLDVEAAELSEEEAKGREVFQREGLWYCEPGYVRQTSVDRSKYNADATTPEQVAGQSPVLFGLERVAPQTVGSAAKLAEACGVVGLSEEDLAAVDAFLDTRG
jgi:hypothetical protein